MIKGLPKILTALTIVSFIDTLYAFLDVMNTSLKARATGSPIPEFEKKLAALESTFHRANDTVTLIYQSNLLQEDIKTLVDELYNIGDKESIDTIIDIMTKITASCRISKMILLKAMIA